VIAIENASEPTGRFTTNLERFSGDGLSIRSRTMQMFGGCHAVALTLNFCGIIHVSC
jgi:hypothetical protein